MNTDLSTIQEFIHHRFDQVKHLETALTHSSYANEHAEYVEHNERLEFLGDAVLELSVTEELFTRFPDAREGDLTRLRAKLVSKPTLSELAVELKLDQYLLLGKGEESQGGRERASLLGDTVEAVLGAIFLDAGFSVAKKWVKWVYEERWPQSTAPEKDKDNKSALQEWTQKKFKERPIYSLVESTGPEHGKTFVVQVELPNGVAVAAKGASMKKAEQNAARDALKMLRREENAE